MKTEEYVLGLIISVIHKKEVSEKPAELSFPEIYQYAKKQKVENICYAAIEELKTLPDPAVMEKWSLACSLNAGQMAVQEEEKSVWQEH